MELVLKKLLAGALLLFLSYLASWTVVYAIVMRGDFSFFFQYLYYAWTGPGEIPALIQLFAIISAIVISGVFLVFRRK